MTKLIEEMKQNKEQINENEKIDKKYEWLMK